MSGTLIAVDWAPPIETDKHLLNVHIFCSRSTRKATFLIVEISNRPRSQSTKFKSVWACCQRSPDTTELQRMGGGRYA